MRYQFPESELIVTVVGQKETTPGPVGWNDMGGGRTRRIHLFSASFSYVVVLDRPGNGNVDIDAPHLKLVRNDFINNVRYLEFAPDIPTT